MADAGNVGVRVKSVEAWKMKGAFQKEARQQDALVVQGVVGLWA